jgi:hypothetical protein
MPIQLIDLIRKFNHQRMMFLYGNHPDEMVGALLREEKVEFADLFARDASASRRPAE